MKLIDAQKYLINLHRNDCLYHLDDDAVECLQGVVTVEQAKKINSMVNKICSAGLDWGIFDCPIGFCVALHNNELDELIKSYDLPITNLEKL